MLKGAILVYYALTCLYTLIMAKSRESQRSEMLTLAWIVPFAGLPLALLANFAASRSVSADAERFEQVVELYEEVGGIVEKPNLTNETSVVPIEDALLLNDHVTRRRIVLDALKEESLDMVAFLKKAVRNEDTETAHYAVAAIMEMKRTMMAQLQLLSVETERSPENLSVQYDYANAIKSYLDSGLMEGESERTYRFFQAEVLERLSMLEKCGETVFADLMECELALGRYDRAEAASERFLEVYPKSELAYYMALKFYYSLRAGQKFQEVLKKLKESPVKVSHRTLEIIRYWSHDA